MAGPINGFIDQNGVLQKYNYLSLENLPDLPLVDYVTPEAFGAKGDGETDDTDAIEQALNDGRAVLIPQNKTYLITRTVHINALADSEKEAKRSRIVFSNGGAKDQRESQFKFKMAYTAVSNEPPVAFYIHVDGFIFNGLCFAAMNNRIVDIHDAWTTGQGYTAADRVKYDGKVYYCNAAHTSDSNNYPGSGATIVVNNKTVVIWVEDPTEQSITLFKCERDIKNNKRPVDIDTVFYNCLIVGAYNCFEVNGRGLNVSSCMIASCGHIAHVKWPTAAGDSGGGANVYHDDETGHRAIRFENNRFHSIRGNDNIVDIDRGKKGETVLYSAIIIEDGNCYGFRFTDNLFDRGYCSFLTTSNEIKAWLISNNLFCGARRTLLSCAGNAEQLVFSNNIVTHPSADSGSVSNIILIGGVLSNSNITNNTIEKTDNADAILVQGKVKDGSGQYPDTPPSGALCISGCNISGNTLGSCNGLSSSRGLIRCITNAQVTSTSIIGNVVQSVTTTNNSSYVILRISDSSSETGSKVRLTNVRMYGNVSAGTTTDYNIGSNPTLTNCRFDF